MVSRRIFLKKALPVMGAAAVSVSILKCYDDDEDIESSFEPTNTNTSLPVQASSINKHTHTVDEVDLAGGEQTVDITGGHPHSVTLTAAHITTLSEPGGTVTITSSGGGHTHSVTFENVTS